MKKIYFLMMLIALFAIANFSFADQTVKLRVQVPDTTMVVYATGGFNGWSTYATPMTKVQDSPKIFEADITVPDNVDAGYNFKFLAGPNWVYEQADPAADFTYGAVGWQGAVVNSFKQYLTPVNIQVNVKVPKTTHYCYITGTFVNWEEPKKQMTFVDEDADGKNYTYTVPNFDPQFLEFKFASGPDWAYEQTQGNFSYLGNGGANNEVSVECTGFKNIYGLGIKVNVKVPATTPCCYITGNFVEWEKPQKEMTFVSTDGDGKKNYTYTIQTNVDDLQNLQFKFAAGPKWIYEQTREDNFYYSNNVNNEVSVECTGFKAIYVFGDITVNITAPVGTNDVYLLGSFGSEWYMDEAITAVKNQDGTFTAVIQNVADVEYKCWNKKDWEHVECQADGSDLLENRKAIYSNTPTVNITVARWKKDIPTEIESVRFDYPISIIDNKIAVSGVQSLVNVYNVYGQVIQSFKGKGDFTSRALPSGIYILQVDESQVKLIVE